MKRLKIVEQIIIVLILSVLTPFIIIGFIISNISQQSVRMELANSTSLMAQFIGDSVENYVNLSQSQLNQMAAGFKYIPATMAKIQYFDEIEAKTKLFKNLDITEKNKIPSEKYTVLDDKISIYSPIDEASGYYLTAQINIDIIDKLLGDKNPNGRKVYIFDSKTQNLITTNAQNPNLQAVLAGLNIKEGTKAALFGEEKNTPKAYYQIASPDWFVIVDTTKKVTAKTINKARYRIILSLCLAALSIFIISGLYTSYLYINIRQLFKGITAISKGNYDKKIHLIKSVFTPYEVVFLAKEFNYMANKINVSYQDLREKNAQLERLNEFRENLISATSHEFRTPLTSIIGYSSRLLRNDIVIDEEMKLKSLHIIKQQAQRLSGMVDDLLVVPELDSCSLKFNIDKIDLSSVLLRAVEYMDSEDIEFITEIKPDLKMVYADEYRLEQIFINLLSNAAKYSLDAAPVKIKAFNEDNVPVVKITNKSEKIPEEIQAKLFDKFIRADSKLTRTTRGTGLGLYIVKGLCDALKIDISFKSDEEFVMTLKFNDYDA